MSCRSKPRHAASCFLPQFLTLRLSHKQHSAFAPTDVTRLLKHYNEQTCWHSLCISSYKQDQAGLLGRMVSVISVIPSAKRIEQNSWKALPGSKPGAPLLPAEPLLLLLNSGESQALAYSELFLYTSKEVT